MSRFSKSLLFFFCFDRSDRLMRQASCGCCCSLKFFVVLKLATAYWKYRWSCLPFPWRFLSLRCYTHARTHTQHAQWLVHAGWAVFISIFFILVHLGHGSVRSIVFTHRRVFWTCHCNHLFSHVPWLVCMVPGREIQVLSVLCKWNHSCPLLSGQRTVVLPSCHMRAKESMAEMHVRTAIQHGRSGWTSRLCRSVRKGRSRRLFYTYLNICQWILIHLCTSCAFMCWEETANIEPAAEAPCHQQKWHAGDGICWRTHGSCIEQLLVLVLHNCTIGSFQNNFLLISSFYLIWSQRFDSVNGVVPGNQLSHRI